MKIVRPSCTLLFCSQSTSFRVYRFLVEPPICQCCIYAHATLWCTIPILSMLPMSDQPDDSWCALPKRGVSRVCFMALCMVAISKTSVEHWKDLKGMSDQTSTQPNQNSAQPSQNSAQPNQKSTEENWEKHKKIVSARFGNMNLIVSIGGKLRQLLKPIYRRVW
jgi:hypothetical protein